MGEVSQGVSECGFRSFFRHEDDGLAASVGSLSVWHSRQAPPPGEDGKRTDWGTIMKKNDLMELGQLGINRGKEDWKSGTKKGSSGLVSTTLEILRDVKIQWTEAENYRPGKYNRRID